MPGLWDWVDRILVGLPVLLVLGVADPWCAPPEQFIDEEEWAKYDVYCVGLILVRESERARGGWLAVRRCAGDARVCCAGCADGVSSAIKGSGHTRRCYFSRLAAAISAAARSLRPCLCLRFSEASFALHPHFPAYWPPCAPAPRAFPRTERMLARTRVHASTRVAAGANPVSAFVEWTAL